MYIHIYKIKYMLCNYLKFILYNNFKIKKIYILIQSLRFCIN